MSYQIKTFFTEAGPVTLDFDFIPAEPTLVHLGKYCAHICETCEFRKFNCGYEDKPVTVGRCPGWSISGQSYADATFAYYKELHEKRYGTARLSL